MAINADAAIDSAKKGTKHTVPEIRNAQSTKPKGKEFNSEPDALGVLATVSALASSIASSKSGHSHSGMGNTLALDEDSMAEEPSKESAQESSEKNAKSDSAPFEMSQADLRMIQEGFQFEDLKLLASKKYQSVFLDDKNQFNPKGESELLQLYKTGADLNKAARKRMLELEYFAETLKQPHAMFDLAGCYRFSYGGKVASFASLKKAFELMKEAADLNLGIAVYELGFWYTQPSKVSHLKKNVRGQMKSLNSTDRNKLAIKNYKKAASLGFAKAQNFLGSIYDPQSNSRLTKYLPDDEQLEETRYPLAFKWYKSAADLGLHEALVNLGLCYEMGIGVPNEEWADRKSLAEKYFALAKENEKQRGLTVDKSVAVENPGERACRKMSKYSKPSKSANEPQAQGLEQGQGLEEEQELMQEQSQPPAPPLEPDSAMELDSKAKAEPEVTPKPKQGQPEQAQEQPQQPQQAQKEQPKQHGKQEQPEKPATPEISDGKDAKEKIDQKSAMELDLNDLFQQFDANHAESDQFRMMIKSLQSQSEKQLIQVKLLNRLIGQQQIQLRQVRKSTEQAKQKLRELESAKQDNSMEEDSFTRDFLRSSIPASKQSIQEVEARLKESLHSEMSLQNSLSAAQDSLRNAMQQCSDAQKAMMDALVKVRVNMDEMLSRQREEESSILSSISLEETMQTMQTDFQQGVASHSRKTTSPRTVSASSPAPTPAAAAPVVAITPTAAAAAAAAATAPAVVMTPAAAAPIVAVPASRPLTFYYQGLQGLPNPYTNPYLRLNVNGPVLYPPVNLIPVHPMPGLASTLPGLASTLPGLVSTAQTNGAGASSSSSNGQNQRTSAAIKRNASPSDDVNQGASKRQKTTP